jgi:probable F420-dependent oxidoreductase
MRHPLDLREGMSMARGIQVGVLLPNTGRGASKATLTEFAALAEDAGVDSLWVGDHIALAGRQETEYPYADHHKATYEVPAHFPFLEAFATLGFAAAVTKRCRLGLGVGILPYRHPLLWAKFAGTLQVLSEGRFDFGVGVGWMREEFEALGTPFEKRGAIANEVLRVFEAIRETPEPVCFSGEYFKIDHMYVNPSIRTPMPPPIWVGGNGKAAATRAARYGDVWYPHVYAHSPETVTSLLAELRGRAVEMGRSGDLRAAIFAPLVLRETPGGHPWETGTIMGPPTYVAELLQRYDDAGVHHITLTFGGSPRKRIDVVEQVFKALR